MPTLWAAVLAAGRGSRLSTVTGGVPKQFWAPAGRRSLLEDTLERLSPLTDAAHTVTVVDDSHHEYLAAVSARVPIGDVIFQPDDRGTAVGVLLATAVVWTCDPAAVLLVTPSDHGVSDADQFRLGVRLASSHAVAHPNAVVLIGATPDSAVGDYGWIVTRTGAEPEDTSIVERFVEKPATDAARQLLADGALWNTMVVVARAEALFDLYRRHLPDVADAFEGLKFLRPADRAEVLRRLYPHLPRLDFSADLLAHAEGLRCLSRCPSMGWTDLGTPERLGAWLARAPVNAPRPGVH